MEIKGVFKFEIMINVLVLSVSFEYLCYGPTAIIKMSTLSARVEFRRQNLTSTDVRFRRLHSITAL